ncbi:MAG: XrtA/PEP-CTERM system TPR-repeat protein PrsT, partial [Rhodanobacter sp.]
MRNVKMNIGTLHRVLTLLCVGLLLSGCGLIGGHDSLAAGTKYQANGDYRSAYIVAMKVLQGDSKNGAAWLLLGQASLMLGRPDDALNELQSARANGVPEAQWAVPMGRVLLVSRQYDKLLTTLSPDKLSDPRSKGHVQVLRGDAQLGLKQLDQAKQSYQAALTLDPKDPRALVGLAKVAATASDFDSASKYVQQALAASPEDQQALVTKGDLAFNSRDFAGAESDYQKALGFKNPDWLPQERFYALTRLANAQTQQNQFVKALASIETLEKMSPQQPYPHYLHAVVLFKQGHLDDAVSQLQQVLKGAPDNVQGQLLMGAVNYAQGNYSQVEMYLSNALGLDQKNVEARKLLALTFYREGRSRQALDTLRPAVPGKPSDTELLAALQRAAAAGAGKPGEKAPATGAGKPLDAQFTPAREAVASGNGAEAIRLLQAIPVGNVSAEAQRNVLLVTAYLREKRPDEATKVAAEHAKKNPNDSAAHLLYGTTLIAADHRPEARAQYEEAYKLDPKSLAALLSLGSLDSLEGHYKEATGRYEAVLKQDPNNDGAMTSLARLAMVQGDSADAIKWFKQAIGAAPKSATAYVGLILLYSRSNQFDEAVGTAKQFV